MLIERLAEFVQFVDVVGGLDSEKVGVGQHRVSGAVGIVQIIKLMLGFYVTEVLAGEDGGGAFADAPLGLRADDESLHSVPFGLIFVSAGGGLRLLDRRQ